ncbi:MAG: response regulator [Candidatus Omnitrophica bacterium]|nr:response regulator [Candidatus Omnitrophota bacterium]
MWKILVVDDNAANREFLIELLREYAVCDIAINGREAFEIYKDSVIDNKPYDMMLLDIEMPEVDGLTVLSLVRAIEASAGVVPGEGLPIIIVTAFEEPFKKAFDLGCDDYMLKPVASDQLIQKIKMKLAGKNKA